jgi:hypothetical protein
MSLAEKALISPDGLSSVTCDDDSAGAVEHAVTLDSLSSAVVGLMTKALLANVRDESAAQITMGIDAGLNVRVVIIVKVSFENECGCGRCVAAPHSTPSSVTGRVGLEGTSDVENAMNDLKVFYLVGWALQTGASSWSKAILKVVGLTHQEGFDVRVMKDRCWGNGVRRRVTKRFEEELPLLFGRLDGDASDAPLVLFERKGKKPFSLDKRITGLTNDGKIAWRETKRFLAKHGGAGPWANENAI